MSSHTTEIGYGTSPKEEQYFQEVLQLYRKIFDHPITRILRRLAVEFRFCSRTGQQLLKEVGFPRGKKLDYLRAPKFVFDNKEYMKRFLRGVIDTDGHVYWRKSFNNYYLIIYWVTTAPIFAEDLVEMLRRLGYHPQHGSVKGTQCDGHKRRRLHRIIVMRHDEVKKFIEEIGFRNNTRWGQVLKLRKNLQTYHLSEPTTTFLSTLAIPESQRARDLAAMS